MPASERRAWLWAIALGAVLVVLSRWLARAPMADDYDSMNFLLGMRHYDLARFQPQFPGYPVYVALGAGLRRLGLAPLTAAVAINALAAGLASLGLAAIAWRLAGPKAAAASVALQLVAWLPWFLGSGALSDGLGVALAVASFALMTAEAQRPFWSGAAAGLTLGVRLSYWPLLIPLAFVAWQRGREKAAVPGLAGLIGLSLGLALWLVPFAALVGPHELILLGRTHVAGHFSQWGGSVVTKPNLWRRARAFGRDLFYDGLAPAPWALGAIGGLALTSLVWRRGSHPIPWRPVLLVLLPYGLWAFFAQNVIEQPRHVLPLVEGLLLLLAMLLAERPAALAATVALAGAVSVPLLLARHRNPPAAAQAAEWLAAHQPSGDTLVAGTRSARFLQDLADRSAREHDGRPNFQVREAPWLSTLIGELARLDRLPGALWVTSEVDLHSGEGAQAPLPAQWRIDSGPTFCRDPRLDRFQPCLSLLQLTWSPR